MEEDKEAKSMSRLQGRMPYKRALEYSDYLDDKTFLNVYQSSNVTSLRTSHDGSK